MEAPADQTWSTNGLPDREAFAFWREAVFEAFLPLEMEPLCDGRFDGSIDSRWIGDVSANRVLGSRHSVARTRGGIARSNDSYYYLLVQNGGSVGVTQSDRQATLGPMECALVSSADRFRFDFGSDIDCLSVQIPHQALNATGGRPEDATGINLTRGTAIGPALTHLAAALPKGALQSGQGQTIALRRTLLDLLDLAVSEITGHGTRGPSDPFFTRHRIERFVEDNLADPELSPSGAAQSLGLSERSLHSALADTGLSFMRLVRQRRVEAASRQLAGRQIRRQSIADIAYEAGFSDLSTFNRAFKTHFGKPPREFEK